MQEPKQYKEGMELSGYIKGMPDSIYHNTDGFTSKSSIHKLEKDSPFKFFNSPKKDPTRSMQMGTALHAKVLESKKFESSFMLLPEISDRRQPEYKSAKKALGEESVFISKEVDAFNGMYYALMQNDDARKYLFELEGWNELSGFHQTEHEGIGFRHRLDRLTKCGYGVDLKKTHSVDPIELSKTIFNFGYHWQDSAYSDAHKKITGEDLKGFVFVFVEDSYPHQVAVVMLDDISKQIGRDEYKIALSQYAHYSKNHDQVHNNNPMGYASLPEWVMRQYENSLEVGDQ